MAPVCRARQGLSSYQGTMRRRAAAASVRSMDTTAPTPLRPLAAAVLAASLATACAERGQAPAAPAAAPVERAGDIARSVHRDGDDLLTAGLGLDGLRSPVPPPFADADAPTAQELRRRAVWANWRGIADLAPGGGFGEIYGAAEPVPGREFHALLKLPGATQPHRVMLQLPDGFDAGKRCVVVTASSGSRGIYGAISLAGAWGLLRGCAVAYTDKGAGTGWFDTVSGQGATLAGTPGGTGDTLEFAPAVETGAAPRVLFKHAHSGDNPEADWGRHVKQAADFALEVLTSELGQPFTHADTRVIAVGVSNGAGAVLRAAGIDGDWLDGVVAVSPNILPGEGGRPLYDYATEAALLMPCALASGAFDNEPLARPGGTVPPAWMLRCETLAQAGLLSETDPAARALEAHARLRANGWTDAALVAGTLSVGFDLWRAVAVTYAAAYARTGSGDMPCGYGFAMLGADGAPRAPTLAERSAWWSDSAGVPPANGVQLIDTMAAGADAAAPGLLCLRGLWDGQGGHAAAVREGIEATRAALPRAGLPVIVVHGADDGLVPEAFMGGAYAAWAKANGRDVRYWRIANAQHFDAFLGLPPLAVRYVPLMPYAYRGLDAMWSHLADGAPLPADAEIAATPRAPGESGIEPLQPKHLALP